MSRKKLKSGQSLKVFMTQAKRIHSKIVLRVSNKIMKFQRFKMI